MGANPIIKFDNVTLQYDAQAAPTLHDINLEIFAGEKVVIIGPSGSGKSTIGHCINGLIPYYYKGELVKGQLTIAGKELHDISEHSAHVATVLQDPDAQFIGMTVGEDIAFALENNLVDFDSMYERVDAAAKTIGMLDFLKAKPHDLSGGQKQKISLAGVLINDAKIALYDEPLANLDPQSGQYAIELIDAMHEQEGLTTIIIEHRLEDVLHRSVDRIIVIDDGRIVANMPPSELLKSNILAEVKLREPLYISALKGAGVDIEAIPDVANLANIDTVFYREAIQKWLEKMELPKQKIAEPLLKVEQIDFSYIPGKPILEAVDFTISKGEMVSIVGPNGAGKSTLSKVICGFNRETGGKLFFNGADMAEQTISERAANIGFVLQNPNEMISKATVFDEVALGLVARGVEETEINTRVLATLEICGLKPFRNWPISALSFGQKKRVTIASILVLEPEVLIVDEPTAGQDYFHYTEIMQFLEEINAQGVTILFITHDMHLMLEYTTRTLVLADKTLTADMSPYYVLTDDALITKAQLKKTSLQYLAQYAGVQPELLVAKVINYEKNQGDTHA